MSIKKMEQTRWDRESCIRFLVVLAGENKGEGREEGT